MNELNGIKETCQRLKADGMPVPESALRRWVKEGLIPAMMSGKRVFLFYPNVVDALKTGVVYRREPEPPGSWHSANWLKTQGGGDESRPLLFEEG